MPNPPDPLREAVYKLLDLISDAEGIRVKFANYPENQAILDAVRAALTAAPGGQERLDYQIARTTPDSPPHEVNLWTVIGQRDAYYAELTQLRRVAQAAKQALAHVQELRDAWQVGAINETDSLGGTRSNRNVDVEVALRDALATLTPGAADGR